MGPRSGERGNRPARARWLIQPHASMGPRSGERGNEMEQGDAGCGDDASMGPRSGERGNAEKLIVANRIVALQWGRAQVSAEISFVTSGRISPEASMGPRSGERG